MSVLIQSIKDTLSERSQVIAMINEDQYSQTLTIFSGSSIGMHARHVVEFYQCLLLQYDHQSIDYEQRKRDLLLQSQPEYFNIAVQKIISAIENLRTNQLNTPLSILTSSEKGELISNSLARELHYNLEHTIHHSALIKIGVLILNPALNNQHRKGNFSGSLYSEMGGSLCSEMGGSLCSEICIHVWRVNY